MATNADVINAGYLDRLISRLSNVGTGQIRPTSAEYLRVVRELRDGTAFDGPGGWGPWREVAEQARLGVNRARRLESGGGSTQPLSSIPDAADPTGGPAARIEVTVIVDMTNPDTGGTARFPIVIETTGRLTLQQIATLAAAAATSAEGWRDYGRGGDIDAGSAVLVRATVVGIVGRS